MHLIRLIFINPFIHVVTELIKICLGFVVFMILGALIAIPTYAVLSARGWDHGQCLLYAMLAALFGATAWMNAIINMPQYKNIRGRAISSMSKGWWSS
jgi:hypothetical protein